MGSFYSGFGGALETAQPRLSRLWDLPLQARLALPPANKEKSPGGL